VLEHVDHNTLLRTSVESLLD